MVSDHGGEGLPTELKDLKIFSNLNDLSCSISAWAPGPSQLNNLLKLSQLERLCRVISEQGSNT